MDKSAVDRQIKQVLSSPSTDPCLLPSPSSPSRRFWISTELNIESTKSLQFGHAENGCLQSLRGDHGRDVAAVVAS
eukprot:2479486-Rhodomonas_salina.1